MLNRISFRQMEYFVSTAQHGSIIVASEKIHVSPPSISAAISHIESELKVKLFIRQHARGLSLTTIGEKILKECLFILGQTYALYELASEFCGLTQRSLHVGCHQILTPLIYSDIVHDFNLLYQKDDIRLLDGSHDELMNALLTNKIDLAITTNLQIDHNIICFEPIVSLPPHVLVSEHHPLAKMKSVALQDLFQFPMILHDSLYYKDYCTDLFRQHNLVPNIKGTYKNYDLVRTMVADGWGYSMTNIRHRLEHTLNGKKLIRLMLEGNHAPVSIGIATISSVNLNEVTEKFKSYCKEFISEYYHDREHNSSNFTLISSIEKT
ncbi:LysR family transcriptional regulator [Acinetobacter lactucae]|uniref:LysR family transcriptional regulator n=1 Tax=Acinetobacter lactucae TaxID=1785128 RepID=UPI001D18DBCF|nr:LysR family transcriptional regulator [Acinetobacter lactucae]